MKVTKHLVVHGRVQGIGYRDSMQTEAARLGVTGWVRNRRDGSVEALFAGPAEVVSEMVARCRHGPSSARVEAVTDEGAGPDALNLRRAGERFSVLPTV